MLYSINLEEEDSYIRTTLTQCRNNLQAKELIDKTYKKGIIAPLNISDEDVIKNLECNKDMKFIRNIIEDMRIWPCFKS